eukprot:TRINITY_DN3187_c0_g1_i1.p1 TRINITY_DN3187_c0_g1~~TRINITY_DN3187_c0_g1_i1.p1  ORF type:complete len:401 (-),score=131.29 TRINITY_DN3187_c0_g1_i1:86-1288(-)
MAQDEGGGVMDVHVTDPVKLGEGVQAYVSYRVTSTGVGPEKRSYNVIRRFSDFVWVHERLAENFKGIIVPPLPEKNVVEKFRFTSEFIEARRRALDIFLHRVIAHPLLRSSSDLRLFFEASEEDLRIEVARSNESNSMFARGGNLVQMFVGMQSSLSSVVMGREAAEELVDDECEKLKLYASALETHFLDCQKQAYRLVKKKRDLGAAMGEFGTAMMELGQGEGGTIERACIDVGQRLNQLSTLAQSESNELLMNFEEPLKEYIRILQAVKATLHDREMAFKQQNELAADIELKTSKLTRLKASSPPPRGDRLLELEMDVKDAIKRAEDAKARYSDILKHTKAEIIRFQKEKMADILKILSDFARLQADVSRDTTAMWRAIVPQGQNQSRKTGVSRAAPS